MEQQDVIIPSTQKPKSNFLFFVLIFCALLLSASSLYLGYQISHSQKQKAVPLTPTPIEETPTWKTYINTTVGYEIKYPREVFVEVTCPNRELLLEKRDLVTSDNRLKDSIDGTSQITDYCSEENVYTIEIKTNSISQTLIPQTDKNYHVTQEEINISGAKAVKYTVDLIEPPSTPYIGWHEVIWIENKDKIILITLIDKNLQNVFDQALSTFKFLQ